MSGYYPEISGISQVQIANDMFVTLSSIYLSNGFETTQKSFRRWVLLLQWLRNFGGMFVMGMLVTINRYLNPTLVVSEKLRCK